MRDLLGIISRMKREWEWDSGCQRVSQLHIISTQWLVSLLKPQHTKRSQRGSQKCPWLLYCRNRTASLPTLFRSSTCWLYDNVCYICQGYTFETPLFDSDFIIKNLVTKREHRKMRRNPVKLKRKFLLSILFLQV